MNGLRNARVHINGLSHIFFENLYSLKKHTDMYSLTLNKKMNKYNNHIAYISND